MIDQQEPPKMEEIELYKIDQQWLDERCYSVPADLEPELNRLADDAGNLADCEHRLIETIRDNKRQLEFLPDIIRFLENKLRGLGDDLAETLGRHDRLAEAHKFLSQQQPAEATGDAGFTHFCSACGKRFVRLSSVKAGDTCVFCGQGWISDIIAEVENAPQFPFCCNECDGKFMGGRGSMPGDICPICSFGRVVNAEVEA